MSLGDVLAMAGTGVPGLDAAATTGNVYDHFDERQLTYST
jgi:hypothetical protein